MAKKDVDININITTASSRKEVDALIKKNKELEDSLANAKNTGGDAFDGSSGVGGFALKAGLAIGGMVLAVKAVTAAFDYMKGAIADAAVEETAVIKLNNALKITGSYSQQASDDFQQFASGLEKLTGTSNESILNQVALAKQLGYSNDQAKQLTTSSMKLANVMGTDVNTAQQQLLQTLTGSIGRLGKMNPELKAFTAEQLRAGAAIDYFNKKNIELDASQKGTEGKLSIMKVATQDLGKAFGKIVIENPAFTGAITDITKAFINIAEEVEKRKGVFGFIANAIEITTDLIGGLASQLSKSFDTTSVKALSNEMNMLETRLKSATTTGAGFTFMSDNEMNEAKKRIAEIQKEITKARQSMIDSVLADSGGEPAGYSNKPKEKFNNKPDPTKEEIKARKEANIELDKLEQERAVASNVNDQLILDEKIKKAQLVVEKQRETSFLSGDEFKKSYDAELEAAKTSIDNAQLLADKKLEIERDAQIKKNKLMDDQVLAEIQNDQARQIYKTASEKNKSDAEVAKAKKEAEISKKSDDQKTKDKAAFYKAALSLQNSNNKALATVGKAFAIQQATIEGYEAISSSYRFGSLTGGPILGAVFAGIAAVATANNIAQIAGIQFADGGYNIGADSRVNGSSVYGDKIPAYINAGESVLNQKEMRVLQGVLGNNTGMGSAVVVELLKNIGNTMTQPQMIYIDGTLISKEINRTNNLRLV
jgi:hypothetical protein